MKFPAFSAFCGHLLSVCAFVGVGILQAGSVSMRPGTNSLVGWRPTISKTDDALTTNGTRPVLG